MTLLVLGLALFFSAHAVPMVPPVSRVLRGRARRAVVSALSLAGFALIVWGKGHAPLEPLWAPPVWGRSLPHALMPLAFILLAAAYVPRNRIRPLVRNPMLAAVILWAIAHLAANGDRASLYLFGGFLAFALIDWWSVSRRPAPERRPGTLAGDAAAVAVGLIAFAATLFAHPYLFGVPATG